MKKILQKEKTNIPKEVFQNFPRSFLEEDFSTFLRSFDFFSRGVSHYKKHNANMRYDNYEILNHHTIKY